MSLVYVQYVVISRFDSKQAPSVPVMPLGCICEI